MILLISTALATGITGMNHHAQPLKQMIFVQLVSSNLAKLLLISLVLAFCEKG
jgi:hypothetical protein